MISLRFTLSLDEILLTILLQVPVIYAVIALPRVNLSETSLHSHTILQQDVWEFCISPEKMIERTDFGRGIVVTNNAPYALRRCQGEEKVLVICSVAPGRAFLISFF